MFLTRYTVIFLVLLLSSAQAGHHHFMMKAIMHGAAMGMMMRPRIMPIPIPLSMNIMQGFLGMMSGMRNQDSPRVIVVRPRRPRPKIIIIPDSDQQQCCNNGWNSGWNSDWNRDDWNDDDYNRDDWNRDEWNRGNRNRADWNRGDWKLVKT